MDDVLVAYRLRRASLRKPRRLCDGQDEHFKCADGVYPFIDDEHFDVPPRSYDGLATIYDRLQQQEVLVQGLERPDFLRQIWSTALNSEWVERQASRRLEMARSGESLLGLLDELQVGVSVLADLPADWWWQQTGRLETSAAIDCSRTGALAQAQAAQLLRTLKALRKPLLAVTPRRRGPRAKGQYARQAVLEFSQLWRAIIRPGRKPTGITVEKFIVAAFEATGLPVPRGVKPHTFEDWLLNHRKRGRRKISSKQLT